MCFYKTQLCLKKDDFQIGRDIRLAAGRAIPWSWKQPVSLMVRIKADIPTVIQARITERISMEILENGTKVMTYEMTMTDPIYYTQPVTETRKWTPLPNGQLLPYHCSEEPWLKLLELRRAQLEAGEAVTATIADVHATKMYE